MKRSFLAAAVVLAALTVHAAHGLALTPEESFRKNYPGISAETIRPTVITGLYEIVTGNEIFYYAPETESLIFGQIVSKDGVNVTAERKKTLLAEKMKALPLEQAVKVGHGRQTVIAVTDPDCPYCRQAFKFFKEGKDVTLYVFFWPLPMHREAEGKVKYILCAQDKEAAYNDVMSGKFDGKQLIPCADKTVEPVFKVHGDLAKKLGITSVPFFFINEQVVIGADLPAIEQLLGKKKP